MSKKNGATNDKSDKPAESFKDVKLLIQQFSKKLAGLESRESLSEDIQGGGMLCLLLSMDWL